MVKTIYQERYKAFIKELVLARKASGLTQMQVAEKLSKPQSYIAKVEGADRKLDVMEFVELCEVIHQDPSELIKLLKP
ncbi:MAG TPA: helix-turn-helix transcriptional regulator [Agitococcus sp.]|nr:helix-turn-helix transcriptional regulator [Agitococcus sp.]HNP02398.1 helix-turn-helix transcriptional regulator [Agitococcus sp.]